MTGSLMYQLKQLFSSVSGQARDAQEFALLSAQIREAGTAVLAARQSVALAKAQHEQDLRQVARAAQNITDLEIRARDALGKGQEKLAREAAEAIAILEDEKTALEQTTRAFEQELTQLSDNLRKAEFRLRSLKRGERTALVRQKVMKATTVGATTDTASLLQAETRLMEIEARQERAALADQAFQELSPQDNPQAMIEKLADAGCGTPLRTSADAILERLKSDIQPNLMIENRV